MNPLSILNASIKRIPANKYALGVVGVVAAAALCIRLAGGEWLVAIAGGVAMLVGMVVLRVFASPGSPGAVGNSPSYQAAVLVWTCLFAFVCVLSLLVGKFYFVLFPAPASQLVDLTLVAVYSDDIGESAQTVFTIRPTETGPIYNEVMTGKDGTTKISLAAGKYILEAVGAPKALPFEVSPLALLSPSSLEEKTVIRSSQKSVLQRRKHPRTSGSWLAASGIAPLRELWICSDIWGMQRLLRTEV
jgi:hypothetical protein